jgi:gliding motility-associated-like protein
MHYHNLNKKTLTVILLLFIGNWAFCQTISTFAGNGYDGYGNNGIPTYSGDGGPALSAQMSPYNIAIDSKGNIYISQASAFYTVRKIDIKTNIITTVAGNGKAGYSGDNGPATSAALNEPRGIAFDSKDNLYIADYWNNCIRRVDNVTGIMTTIAGDGNKINGYTGNGGVAIDALLFEPQDITFDKNDNLYFTDFNNNCIRKIDAGTGIITKIAGSDPPGYAGFSGDGGPAKDAKLFAPWSIVADNEGNIIFSDFVNNRIRKIDTQTGIITTIAGNGEAAFGGDDGPAINAQVYGPYALAIDQADNIYVCSGVNSDQSYRVRKINSITGIITTVVGKGTNGYSGDGGPPLNAQLDPNDIAFDKDGNMFIADLFPNFRIRKITSPVLVPPSIDFAINCEKNQSTFSVHSKDEIDAVIWNFGDPASGEQNTSNDINTQHTFSDKINYTVSVTVFSGTKSITGQQVIEMQSCENTELPPTQPPVTPVDEEVTVPNTFTPNDDSINDKFKITSSPNINLLNLQIYNRYGLLLFTTNDISKYWDGEYNGKKCPPGVYYYVIRYQTQKQGKKFKAGSITIFR